MELYERYRRLFFSAAFAILHEREEAEDCVQDVLLRLWERRERYGFAERAFVAFAVVSIRNAALDRLRRKRRQPELERRLASAGEAFEEFDVSDHVEHERLMAAIRNLPAAQRRPLVLAYYAHKTHAEIAAELNVPVGTVKSRLSLAVRRLAKLLHVDSTAHA